MKPIWVNAGDTFFTHSSTMLGKLIRWGETDPDEKGTNGAWANHTGVVVESGWLVPPADLSTLTPATQTHRWPDLETVLPKLAVVVEALWHVRKGPLKLNGTQVRVFRPVPEYSQEELDRFINEAHSYIGNRYGWWKLGGQLLDRLVFKGKKVVTKLFFIDSRPICSFLGAKVNDKARPRDPFYSTKAWDGLPFSGKWPGFGMAPQSADPDEMLDFCETHPEFWQEVK